MPGQFGPSRRDLEIFTTLTALISSSIGMPSVMQTMKSTPASAASRMPSAAKRAGTKMQEAFAPVGRHGVLHGVEDGNALDGLAALAGGDAADDLSAVGDHLLRVELALAPRDALDNDLGVFVYQDAHACSLRRLK